MEIEETQQNLNLCAYCQKEDNLVRVCKCSYHKECLAKLILVSNKRNCQICGAKFDFFVTYKGYWSWFLDRDNLIDVLSFFGDAIWACVAHVYLMLKFWRNIRQAFYSHTWTDTVCPIYWMGLIFVLYLWEIDTVKYWDIQIRNWTNSNFDTVHVLVTKLSKVGKERNQFRLIKNQDYGACNDSGRICRICRGNETEDLLTPCSCKGSLANVHKYCLERWLKEKPTDSCEICLYRFKTNRIYESLFNWWTASENLQTRISILKTTLVLLDSIPRDMYKVIVLASSIYQSVFRETTSASASYKANLSFYVALAVFKGIYFTVFYSGMFRKISEWRKKNGTVNLICDEAT